MNDVQKAAHDWRIKKHSVGMSFDVTLDQLFETIHALGHDDVTNLVIELMAHDSRVEIAAREWMDDLDAAVPVPQEDRTIRSDEEIPF